MNELLTPEDKFSLMKKYDIDSPLAVDKICQAQYYKDTHPPKLDKPDGKGWWWFIPSKNEMPELRGFYKVTGLRNDYGVDLFWLEDGVLACKLKGKWQRAIMPE